MSISKNSPSSINIYMKVNKKQQDSTLTGIHKRSSSFSINSSDLKILNFQNASPNKEDKNKSNV